MKYRCRPDWYDAEDYTEIEASSPEEAAEEFAKDYDASNSEYPTRQIVCVADENGIELFKFNVWAETIRLYHAQINK